MSVRTPPVALQDRPIILVGPLPPPPTGQALAFQMLVQGLHEHGIATRVLDLAGRQADRVGLASPGRLVEYLAIVGRLLRLLSTRRLAGVYLTIAPSRQGVLRDAVIVALARARRLRVVGHVHAGNYDVFYAAQRRPVRWLARAVLTRLESVVILSTRLRGMFTFAPELDSRLQVVHNAAPISPAGEAHIAAKQPPHAGGPIRLLFLSNLITSKGYLDAIEATRVLRDEGFAAELVLAGAFLQDPGDPRDRRVSPAQAEAAFHADVRARGLAHCVRYDGTVHGEAKTRLLRDAHFMVLPSYYSIEGQPLAVAEALAWGVVPITTAYRAIPDLVVDGTTGIHVPPRDPAAIAQAIARTVTEPGRYRQLSTAAYAHFISGFSVTAHVEAMIHVLAAALPAAADAQRGPQ